MIRAGPPSQLPRAGGESLAYRRVSAEQPTIVLLGGFHSDMTGSKAHSMESLAVRRGWSSVRFDYFGHGASSGDFASGTIGRWRDDALAVIDELTAGPLVLVGSSMGGWIALLAALARPQRVGALVGIASAPDFTEKLIWNGFSEEQRGRLRREGVVLQPSEYQPEPYPISLQLIEEARQHLVLGRPISVRCPVRLLHGLADTAVPWQLSLRLAETLHADDVELILIKHGDHRLSAPTDLQRLCRVVSELCARRA